jgi:hypothetical protein
MDMRAEDDHRGNSHRRLIGFDFDGRLGTQYRGRSTDAAAHRREEGNAAVHAQQPADEDATAYRHRDDEGIYTYRRQANCRDVLKREFETIEDDTDAQHPLGTEVDTRDPCVGQIVAQAVGIEHA